MEPNFIVHFNRGKQFFEAYLWEVHPTTFERWGGGRWGYWHDLRENDKVGKFGEMHFVKGRLRIDTIIHELDHLRTDWMWSRGFTITRNNEERMATFLDELTRRFVRELKKNEPRIKL